jgi:hypothetical protein
MPRAFRPACWLVVLVVAGLQAFATRHAVNPDGLAYLDIARAFLALNFERAIDSHWGPLYPSLLALALHLTRPSPAWVIPMAHAVNFGIFLGTLVAFEFFLRELLKAREGKGPEEKPAITNARLSLFAYAVFIYSVSALDGLRQLTPDLCVAAVVFAAAGLVLAMARRGPTWASALLLGVILGVGYLAKNVMLVLGLVLVASLPLAPTLRPRALRYGAVVVGAFGVVATLLIIPISRERGGLTFGTSGKLAYAFVVNKVPYTNWQGDSAPTGTRLLHPPRRVSRNPEIFEYTAHAVGTYPPWFDPTYWTAGLRTEFHLSNEARALYRSVGAYVNLFLGGPGVAATLLVVLVWLGKDDLSVGRQLRDQLPLIAFAVVGLAIYLPIHVEGRFIASFAALLWLLPVAAARRLEPRGRVEWLDRAALACAACLVMPVALHAGADAWESRHALDPHPKIAAQLRSLGIRPGDQVANIGIEQGDNAGSSFQGFWAFLAQVQIIAEIPDGRDFLCADQPTVQRAYAELARVGARAAVTMAMPSRWCSVGWQQVAGTNYYTRLLDHAEPD